jgi:hypothetical protein
MGRAKVCESLGMVSRVELGTAAPEVLVGRKCGIHQRSPQQPPRFVRDSAGG